MNALIDIVKEVFSEYADVGELDADTPFDSLDIDSLVLVELAVLLNERLGFIVAEFEIKQANCVRRMAELRAQRQHIQLIPEGTVAA